MNQSEMIGSRLKEERLQQKLTLKQLKIGRASCRERVLLRV